MRLRWPGGNLNGGEVRDYPLLAIGGDYIFVTLPTARVFRNHDGSEWSEDHGEEAIITRPRGDKGVGILAVQGGVVVPAFPDMAARLQHQLAQDATQPAWRRLGEKPVPAWGLPVRNYLALLHTAASR